MAKIGLIQVEIIEGQSIKERQDMLFSLAEAALQDGADIVHLPEAFQYVEDRKIIADIPRLTETAKAWKQRMSALAQKYHAYVVPWDYWYNPENGRVYNASYILDRNGEEIGRYCKANLTHGELEISGLANGMEYPVFDLDIGRVAIMICFDNYFPEVAAAYGAQDADLLLYPLYGDTLKPQWEHKMRARAIDHSMFVASCQIAGQYDIAYTGLVDKTGEVIAKLDAPQTYKVIEVDLKKRVLTHTTGRKEYTEDLHEYLHRCRNFTSYKAVENPGAPAKSWEEIFFGKVPD